MSTLYFLVICPWQGSFIWHKVHVKKKLIVFALFFEMETEQLEQAMMCMQEGLSNKRKESNRLKNGIIQMREKNKKLTHENRKLRSQLEYSNRKKNGKSNYKSSDRNRRLHSDRHRRH